ncbi:calpain-10 isoform X2 [Ornithorhynchus anatinus]|uniref:calpain-10 isoform X2 n=1 Tax=Ornithorhynchus anatinus TaxID=9258 RepID=UPI0010A92D53|nr:calpain-10 isoform X2 [Ornithorhynchus anatinus]
MLKMPTDGREPFTERQFFKDATFPACDSSIFFNFSTPLAQFRGDISWLRPQEICSNPRLFPENPREGQVKQGILGDCWFLCACAALQKSKHLLDQVIVPGQPSWSDQAYRGRFTCRVWRFGQWTEVTVDDRLPCLGGRLCFSQCQAEDVFWLPLLEKAYAKLHGSYEHLWAGQVADALVDLTGGLAERWTLKETGRSGEKPSGRSSSEKTVFQRLLHLKDQCVISCSVLSSRQGASDLGEFHAFIVSDVRDVCSDSGGRLLLLRIQNPWGRRCWQGAWREGGEGWNRLDSKLASELLSMVQEGEFWVEEEEFVREFDEVTVGYPVTEEGCLQSLYSETPAVPDGLGRQDPGSRRRRRRPEPRGAPREGVPGRGAARLEGREKAVQPGPDPVGPAGGRHRLPRLRPGGPPALRVLPGLLPGGPQRFSEGRRRSVPAPRVLHGTGLPQRAQTSPRQWLGQRRGPGRGVGDGAAGGELEKRADGRGKPQLPLLPQQSLLPSVRRPRPRGPEGPGDTSPALPGSLPSNRLPHLPGAGERRPDLGGVPLVARGAFVELRAALLRPGSQPTLPACPRELRDRALHLPA